MISDEQDTKLNMHDVQLLKENPSVDARISMIAKLSDQYKNLTLSAKEQQIAQDIFKMTLADTHILVRKNLAFNLKDAPFLPSDLVQMIIQDKAEVACAFIQASSLLSEADLILLLNEQDETKQIAVATRKNISPRISEALIEKSSIAPVLALLHNENARLSDYAYQRLIERFSSENAILQALLICKQMPAYILEKLVSILPNNAQKQLLEQRDLPEHLLIALVSHIRENAILSLDQSATEQDVQSLVFHLHNMNMLSPNLLLRIACVGDMQFFEYAIALCAGIPIRNARILIHDSGSMGLERLYEEAKLPAELYPAISLAVNTYQEMMQEAQYDHRDHFCRRLLERLLILFEEKQIRISSYDMDYFLHKIGKKGSQRTP